MSKSITTSSHHLTKLTLSALLAALALLAGLGLLLARPAFGRGPVVGIGDLPPAKAPGGWRGNFT